jgi:hypothetical protein
MEACACAAMSTLSALVSAAPWVPLIFLTPLLIMTIPGWRMKPDSPLDLAVRVWPLVASGQFVFILASGVGNSASHSLRGITIPLAIVAVQGFLRTRGRARMVLSVLAGSVALAAGFSTFKLVDYGLATVSSRPDKGYFLDSSQRKVIAYLNSGAPAGGVLAPDTFSAVIAAHTDRRVWSGHFTWTKDYIPRLVGLNSFYSLHKGSAIGRLYLAAASGARIVVVPCGLVSGRPNENLVNQLKPLTAVAVRKGCYSVLVLKRAGLEPN